MSLNVVLTVAHQTTQLFARSVLPSLKEVKNELEMYYGIHGGSLDITPITVPLNIIIRVFSKRKLLRKKMAKNVVFFEKFCYNLFRKN